MKSNYEINKVPVLSIPIFSQSLEQVVRIIMNELEKTGSENNRLVSATSAHGLIIAQSDERFADILKSFYCNLPDGMPVVWIGRFKGAKEMRRCYGPQLFENIIRCSCSMPIKHFFCGGKEGVAEELKQICQEKFYNYNCVGTFSPPFRELSVAEFQSLGNLINNSGADVIWIGISTPNQEIFAKRLSEFVKVRFIITVGAAFDFHTGKVKEAPKFMQKNGLEWLFRLMVEPKRLFKRYFKIVPIFLLFGALDILKFHYLKIKGD